MPRTFSRSFGAYKLNATDGIIDWFNGPHWDKVAYESFLLAEAQIKSAAQDKAIWDDRTGAAREGLETKTLSGQDGRVSMALFHTVEYGIWLELIQNGKFAVIMSTLEQEAPRLMSNAMERIRRARRGTIV